MMNEAIPIPPRLLLLASLSSLLTYLAPTQPIIIQKHSEIILEKQFTPSCICTFGVRIVICKPQRKTWAPLHQGLLFKISKHQPSNDDSSHNIEGPPLPFLLQLSPGLWMRSGGGEKNVSNEIYNRDPSSYSPWCGQLVFCRIFRPPMVFPISN